MKQTFKKILAVLLTALMVGTFALCAFADEVASDGATTQPTLWDTFLNSLITIGPLVLIVVLFYFILIRPQKKQEKESQAMRNSISVGDTITTIGGITGTVMAVKDEGEIFILETGADKNRISIRKWAVQSKDKSAE